MSRQFELLEGEGQHVGRSACSGQRLRELPKAERGETLGAEAWVLGSKKGSQFRHRLWVRLAMGRE